MDLSKFVLYCSIISMTVILLSNFKKTNATQFKKKVRFKKNVDVYKFNPKLSVSHKIKKTTKKL